jgi:tetratricopeptide (TPR) repeat protein
VLGVRRQQADVPSGLIPYLYRDYLRTGDARDMKRVLYHNRIDILSLVTLASRLCWSFADPWNAGESEERRELSGEELYALGRWYASEGRTEKAERAFQSALRLCSAPGCGLSRRTLRELAYLLKRGERRDEAFALWQQLALESADDVLAHVELAKYFEWYAGDLTQAAAWTRAALRRVAAWDPGIRRDDELVDLRHRLSRLERKVAGR